MALTVGDGPNRGKSAPSPRALPKPKPERPRTVAEALSGASTGVGYADRPLVKMPEWHYTPQPDIHPPALAPRGKEAMRLYNDAERAPAFNKAQAERTANMYQSMADRQRKADLRADREKKDRKETDRVLSQSEWASLTPMQQAAAQANFDLDNAIKRDFKTQGKHTANAWQNKGSTDRIESYEKRVKELFGENGSVGYKGLEFAPNTLAFLESRGIDTKEELGGRTLDDIISGDALIDEESFAALGKPTENDSRVRNVTFAKSLAQGQLNYQEQLATQLKRGDQLLNSLTERGTNAQAGKEYGALAMPAATKMTAVRPELAGRVDTYMEILARPDIPIDKALDSIGAELMERKASDKEQAQIWENLVQRTRQASTGEAQWFDDVQFTMRSPIEVAQALGATTLKRAGAK